MIRSTGQVRFVLFGLGLVVGLGRGSSFGIFRKLGFGLLSFFLHRFGIGQIQEIGDWGFDAPEIGRVGTRIN